MRETPEIMPLKAAHILVSIYGMRGILCRLVIAQQLLHPIYVAIIPSLLRLIHAHSIEQTV